MPSNPALVRQIKELKAALKPFAMVPITGEDGPVWLYVGKPIENCKNPLHTDDFRLARRLSR